MVHHIGNEEPLISGPQIVVESINFGFNLVTDPVKILEDGWGKIRNKIPEAVYTEIFQWFTKYREIATRRLRKVSFFVSLWIRVEVTDAATKTAIKIQTGICREIQISECIG